MHRRRLADMDKVDSMISAKLGLVGMKPRLDLGRLGQERALSV
jgi:hypothetical protein